MKYAIRQNQHPNDSEYSRLGSVYGLSFVVKIKPLFLFALLLLLSNNLLAEIRIGYIQPTNGGECNGAIEVIANGTAGPFELRVLGDNGAGVGDVPGLIHVQQWILG